MTDSLPFPLVHRLECGERALFRFTEDAIGALGMDVATGASGARRQDLRDGLDGRAGRGIRTRWHWGIAFVAPEEMRAAIARALVEPLGYGIAPIKPLSDAEKLARLEYRVATELGAAGLRVVEENRR